MSKKTYVGIYATSLGICLALGFLFAVVAALQNFVWFQDRPGPVIQLVALLGILAVTQFLFVNIIYNVVILWKMWSSIQDGHARATPGKAIGFLLIPFFNIYWIFQAWGGFPKDYNSFIERHKLDAPPLASGVYTAYPIMTVLTLIPFAGILPALINMFLMAVITSRTCDAVNALAAAARSRMRMATPVVRTAIAG